VYPYESEETLQSLRRLLHSLEESHPEVFSEAKETREGSVEGTFPSVANCSQCPDFDICSRIMGEKR